MKRIDHSAFFKLAAALLLAAPSTLLAQSFPSKPIRIVSEVPPSGTASDLVARWVAQKMSESFGQPAVVDTRPGANGMIAADMVAKAPPDGYTILIASPGSIITAVFLTKNMPYDPVADLMPISAAVEPMNFLLVRNALKLKSIKEVIDYAKSNPGKLTYSSVGIGSVYHLTMEAFKAAAGVDIVHVPYKGPLLALNDLLGGQIDLVPIAVAAALPQVRAGKATMIALLETKRYSGSGLADLPTIAETVPGFDKPASWFGFFGPKSLPQPILGRLHGEIVKAMNAPEFRPKLEEGGMRLVANTPGEFAAMIKAGYESYGRAAKVAGIKPE